MSLVSFDSTNNSIYPGIEPAYLLAEKIVAGTACIISVFGALLVIFSFTYDFETRFSFKELCYKICCGHVVQEKLKNGEWVTKYQLKSYNFILINLSIADIIVALSHFWGLLSNLEHKFAHQNESTIARGRDVSCTTQATFTVLSTLSSFFWTDILAVFLALQIMFFKKCTSNSLSCLKGNLTEDENGMQKVKLNDSSRLIMPSDKKAAYCCESPLFLYVIFPFIGWGIPMIMLLVFATKNMLGYVQDYDAGI